MVTLTESTLRGGAQQTSSRRVHKWAEEKNFDLINGEKMVFCVRVHEFRRKSFVYVNRSSVNACTLKVYGSLDRVKPADVTDADVYLIYDDVLAVSSNSGELVCEQDYEWLILTIDGGAVEANVGDGYFKATND